MSNTRSGLLNLTSSTWNKFLTKLTDVKALQEKSSKSRVTTVVTKIYVPLCIGFDGSTTPDEFNAYVGGIDAFVAEHPGADYCFLIVPNEGAPECENEWKVENAAAYEKLLANNKIMHINEYRQSERWTLANNLYEAYKQKLQESAQHSTPDNEYKFLLEAQSVDIDKFLLKCYEPRLVAQPIEKPQPNKIYFHPADGVLSYTVLGPDGNKRTGEITQAQLNAEIAKPTDEFEQNSPVEINSALTLEVIRPVLRHILKLTAENKHTQFIDMNHIHDALIDYLSFMGEMKKMNKVEVKRGDKMITRYMGDDGEGKEPGSINVNVLLYKGKQSAVMNRMSMKYKEVGFDANTLVHLKPELRKLANTNSSRSAKPFQDSSQAHGYDREKLIVSELATTLFHLNASPQYIGNAVRAAVGDISPGRTAAPQASPPTHQKQKSPAKTSSKLTVARVGASLGSFENPGPHDEDFESDDEGRTVSPAVPIESSRRNSAEMDSALFTPSTDSGRSRNSSIGHSGAAGGLFGSPQSSRTSAPESPRVTDQQGPSSPVMLRQGHTN